MRSIIIFLEMKLLGGTVIEVRECDGFVNATQLCKAGNKKFSNWYQLNSTKELIEELKINLQKSGSSLLVSVIDTKKGRYNSGSWIHPDLAVQLAQWISPTFAIQVSAWVNEWRNHSTENESKFRTALLSLKPSLKTQKEKEIQDRLCRELEAETEVRTPAGSIDLLTSDQIIEIKCASNWKHAIGQVLSYGFYFPDKKKVIVLFGECKDKEIVQQICEAYSIEVNYEP